MGPRIAQKRLLVTAHVGTVPRNLSRSTAESKILQWSQHVPRTGLNSASDAANVLTRAMAHEHAWKAHWRPSSIDFAHSVGLTSSFIH